MRRRQFEDARMNRQRRGYVAVAQESLQRSMIDAPAKARHGPQSLKFRRKSDALANSPVVKRLLTEAVAGQMQHARAPVESRESKHAVNLVERGVQALASQRLQQHLCIRMTAPACDAFNLKSTTQLAVVVYLAVESNDPAPTVRHHGLGARRRQVKNGQPPVRKPNA